MDEIFENLPLPSRETINASGDTQQKVTFMAMMTDHCLSNDEIFNYFNEKQIEVQTLPLPETDLEYKFQEYKYLLQLEKKGKLITKPLEIENFDLWFQDFFSAVTQVNELTITNAFYGFDRIEPQTNRTIDNYKSYLRASSKHDSNWLPAVQVHGEGIFIQFNLEKMKQWSLNFEKVQAYRVLVEKVNNAPLF